MILEELQLWHKAPGQYEWNYDPSILTVDELLQGQRLPWAINSGQDPWHVSLTTRQKERCPIGLIHSCLG